MMSSKLPSKLSRIGVAVVVFLSLAGLGHCPDPDPPHTSDRGTTVVLPNVLMGKHSSSSCGGTEENTEPNGDLFSAVQLDRQVCNSAVTKITGRLASQDDADVFALPMNSGCSLPFLSSWEVWDRSTQLPKLTVVKGDDTTEICFFGSCDYGLTASNGCASKDTKVSPAHLEEGMQGCCITGTGTFVTEISCDSYSPSISGFIVVKATSQDCHDNYEINFSISDP